MNPVKPKSQHDKRLDGFSGGGSEYYAGEGIILQGKTFSLSQANRSNIGGIRLSLYKNVPADDTSNDRNYGLYKGADAFPALRTARNNQKGGMFLGDGLVPHLDLAQNSQGAITYKVTDYVELRLGEGLEFVDEAYADVIENAKAEYGGRAVAVTKATKEKFGMVKLGNRIGIDADGSIYSAMFGKKGIEVSDKGEISVLIDDDTIRVDGNGKLYAPGTGGEGAVIENAVVIQEADAKYLLHEYTEVKYVAGNKIGYAGAGNQIIVGGYILKKQGTALDTSGSAMYTGATFPKGGANASAMIDNYTLRMEVGTVLPNYTSVSWWDNISTSQLRGVNTYDLSRSGMNFYWNGIYPPDTNHPFGYVAMSVSFMYVNASGLLAVSASQTKYADFASEAEYNAAIGLTYEPNELVEIQETVTEA